MTMLPGQASPCPMCGSANVRWRGRRFYDVPLTWTRHVLEFLFFDLFTGTSLSRYRSPQKIRHDRYLDATEARTGWRTATGFWKCLDCKRRGQAFDPRTHRRREPRVEDRTRPPL